MASPLLPPPLHTPPPKSYLSVASSPHWKEVKEWLVVLWTFLKHGFDHFLKTCLRVEIRAAAAARSEETPGLSSEPIKFTSFLSRSWLGVQRGEALDLPVNKLTGTFEM